ncbi:MAG: ABC transporter permease [Anaerolineaceae bacterium]|nr:ABC transporter permease [Anaerolineaceae bacterium]
MKSITIALKDLGRAFRSMFALAFMFGVPILMTLLFAFLFGGMGGSDTEFTIPKTTVQLVNLDAGSDYVPGFEFENQTTSSLGEMLVSLLQEENFSELMSITIADEAEARAAVDGRKAGLAIIIPPGFTNALIGMAETPVAIEFYKDPELSLGPQITESIVMSVVDGFSSGIISMDAILEGLGEQGIELSPEQQAQLVQSLTKEGEANGRSQDEALIILPPTTSSASEPVSLMQTIVRSIMGGMMIFYAFYTGVSAAQTILQEQERGTLARLFISPTPTRTILNGKFLAGFLMILVQGTTLLAFGRLTFRVNWGSLQSLALFTVGLVALASSFGIFVMSFVKDSKQAGVIYGALLTFTGMLGISSVFTVGTAAERAFEFIPLVVPQGWAMNALQACWEGNLVNSLLFTGGMLAWALVFFLVGNARFNKRFA